MSIDRYAVNTALQGVAYQFGVDPTSFDSEAEYDEWLNDLTHYVADAIVSAGKARWEVFDNVTDVAISKPYAEYEHAVNICASFNTPAAGGRYGVRQVP